MKFTILADPSLVIIALHVICLNHVLVKTRRGEEILRVHDMTTPQHKTPCIEGDSIYNFCRLFPDHHYYTLSLSDLCLSEEKKILKEIMHFHYITHMATLLHKNPCPGVMKYSIFVDPSLDIITIYVYLV